MKAMREVYDFLAAFRPRKDKYRTKDTSGNVRTIKSYLPDDEIDDHMARTGYQTISFFAGAGERSYLGIDIDDHDEGGWIRGSPTPKLVEKYNEVVRRIGKAPSANFASSRGVHAFWFFRPRLPNRLLKKVIGEKIEKGKLAEVLPTASCALAIPRPDEYLDSELKRQTFPGYVTLVRYPVAELFGKEIMPEALRAKEKKGKGAAGLGKGSKVAKTLPSAEPPRKGTNPEKNIEAAEAFWGVQLRDHHSNDVYVPLVVAYKVNGLTTAQAFDRIIALIDRTPSYTSGNLRIGLMTRIEGSYDKLGASKSIMGSEHAALRKDAYAMAFIDHVVDEVGLKAKGKTRGRQSLEEFLLNILSWKISLDRLMKDTEKLAEYDYKHPKSERFMKEGYYPLPYTLLHGWNAHYNKNLALLKKFGVLVESPYNYTTTGGRCKYYGLNFTECRLVHWDGSLRAIAS